MGKQEDQTDAEVREAGQSRVSFEPGFMRDKAGNLIQGTATAPVKPKQ
ncbi:hypothetical protein [Brevibacillus formosus]|nr:hypothetical protein [Brevibacillus formosus]